MLTIVRKDLAIELRTGEMASSMFLLALLVILVFAFTLEPERLVAAEFLAGLCWTTLLVAGTLALNRSFVLEREAGGLTGLTSHRSTAARSTSARRSATSSCCWSPGWCSSR